MVCVVESINMEEPILEPGIGPRTPVEVAQESPRSVLVGHPNQRVHIRVMFEKYHRSA